MSKLEGNLNRGRCGEYVANSPYVPPLRREAVQFLIFCLGHKACFVLSLASAGRGGGFLNLPFSILRSVHSSCLICEFNLFIFASDRGFFFFFHLQLITIMQIPWGLTRQGGARDRSVWKPISHFPDSQSSWKSKGVPNTWGVNCVPKQLETPATFRSVLPGNQLGFLA